MFLLVGASFSSEYGNSKAVDLPMGGGGMKIPSDWVILGETDPILLYDPEDRELKKHERDEEEIDRVVQVMKYPLDHKGSNPFVTVEWIPWRGFHPRDGQAGVRYITEARITAMVGFYEEIDIKTHPKSLGTGGGAEWSFEARLPERIADFADWRGVDYVQEYVIPGRDGFWIVSGTYPKKEDGDLSDGAKEVEAILQSIPNLREGGDDNNGVGGEGE